jgi:hypothetical protein
MAPCDQAGSNSRPPPQAAREFDKPAKPASNLSGRASIEDSFECAEFLRAVRPLSCRRRLARLLLPERRRGNTRLLLFLHLYQRQAGVAGNDFEDGVG